MMAVAFPALSDELLGTVVPIAVYWIYSGFYSLLHPLDRFRLHSRSDEATLNVISKPAVIRGVLLQQSVQAAVLVALYAFAGTSGGGGGEGAAPRASSPLAIAWQFAVAMLVMDTWQYFLHRLMHRSRFLYRHLHSRHHRLVAPYAFGALYNHPVEGLLADTMGGVLSFLASGMSSRTSIFFFSFATIKTVDDHSGLLLPFNPFHWLFENNTAYHDIHHQIAGGKYNLSQPFFVMWDKILGTHMPYTIEKREDGGLEARAARRPAAPSAKAEKGN